MVRCEWCGRRLPVEPSSMRTLPVAHVRLNGARCVVGRAPRSTYVTMSPEQILDDDSLWDLESESP